MEKRKRPQSCFNNDYIKNKTKKKHVAINCFRGPLTSKNSYNRNQIFKGTFSEDKKNYTFSPNSYADKYKSQIKKYNMYNEMCETKSISDEDFYGLSESIKIQPENKKFDYSTSSDKYKVNANNTRLSSATTYYDIGYKSKRIIKGIIESNINLNIFSRNMIKNRNNKKNQNNMNNINNNINRNNLINSYNYYNLKNNNKYNPDTIKLYKNQNYNGSTMNFSNLSNIMNFKSSFNDIKEKEDQNINENESKNKDIDIEDKEQLKKDINKCNTANLQLRTEYLIKLSKLVEMCKKFEKYSDYFRIEKREFFLQTIKNFARNFDKCNDYILNEIKIGEIIDIQTMTNMLIYYFNFTYSLLKYQKNIFNEMHFMKIENLNIKKRLSVQEIELNTKNKDLNEINKYIIHYDLTNKVKYGKQKELSIEEMKQKFISKESAYVLTINKLEEEIKQLTIILEQNKYDVNNFEKLNKKLIQTKDDFDKEKELLEHQNDEKDIKIKLLEQSNADLNEKINDLESEIQKLKDKDEKMTQNIIEYETKIKNLNDIINNKKNKIEELEKENKVIKEKKTNDNKMLPPADTVFIPMKEKIRKRKKIQLFKNE